MLRVRACSIAILTLGILANAPAFAALTPYDVPNVTCESATLASITVNVCAKASGAPAGVTIQWKTAEDYAASGWADDGTLCKLSLSGQPSMQHPGKSRWELEAGECETITLGDINFDETGVSGTGCGLDPLQCGTEYVIRWFAHAGRGFGRSDWGGNLVCSTTPCPPAKCTYTQGYWKNHGGPAGCNQAPVNPPDPVWPAAIMTNGLMLGTVQYTAAELCTILNTPAAGKGLIALAHQLIAAYLNLANGATRCPELQQAIADANAAIGNVNLIALAGGNCGGPPESRPPGCGAGVPPANVALTAFNEGALCPGNCHGGSPDPECAGQTCSNFTTCNPGGSCGTSGVCGSLAEGGGLCVNGATPCAGLLPCLTSADCPNGGLCFVNSCCGRPVCVPPDRFCSNAAAGMVALEPSAATPTVGGSTFASRTTEQVARLTSPTPGRLWMSPASPNPSSNGVTFQFALPRESRVTLEVFDLFGRRVVELLSTNRPAGPYSAWWNFRNSSGADVAPGMYLIKLRAGSEVATQRVMRVN